MKKMMMVLSLFAALQASSQLKEDRSMDDLVGSWRNKYGVGMDIVDSNTVYLVRGDQRRLAYAKLSNLQKNPLSLTLMVKDSSRILTLKGVLLLMGDNTLQWQVYDSDTRPASYNTSRGEMLYLRRIDKLLN